MEDIDQMLLDGDIEISGTAADGALLWRLTEQGRENYPEIFDKIVEETNKNLWKLWHKGYVDVDFDIDDPIVTIRLKALAEQKKGWPELTEDEVVFIEELLNVIRG